MTERHRVDDSQLFTTMQELVRALPNDALERLQFVTPSRGCPNACTFCSQRAETRTTELSPAVIEELFESMGAEAKQRQISLGGERRHKPGVIYPHLDNDPLSYTGLDRYVAAAGQQGMRVRFSSVGYSRHNPELQAMHERIVDNYADFIDGMRFSVTPYAVGWKDSQTYSHEEYTRDLTNAITTYLPVAESVGFGRDRFCIATRVAPDVHIVPGDLEHARINDHRVLHMGPFSIVVIDGEELLEDPARIIEMKGRKGYVQHEGAKALLLASADTEDRETVIREALLQHESNQLEGRFSPLPSERALARHGRLYTFHNADGNYFAFDPFGQIPERFDSLLLYPKTQKREVAGYLDATRHMYEELRTVQYDPGDMGSSPEAYAALRELVVARADRLEPYLPDSAAYIRHEVLPILEVVLTASRDAGVPPRAMFGGGYFFDAGHIHNVGRATKLFGGLASSPCVSLTPVEQKIEQEDVSNAAQRGVRWAARPTADGLEVAELHPITMDTVGPHGETMRWFRLQLGRAALIERTQRQSRSEHLLPGIAE